MSTHSNKQSHIWCDASHQECAAPSAAAHAESYPDICVDVGQDGCLAIQPGGLLGLWQSLRWLSRSGIKRITTCNPAEACEWLNVVGAEIDECVTPGFVVGSYHPGVHLQSPPARLTFSTAVLPNLVRYCRLTTEDVAWVDALNISVPCRSAGEHGSARRRVLFDWANKIHSHLSTRSRGHRM